ncbi:PEP-CTERM sorting domain-containing protein [Baaleninema sp.]|uniref:PEP-CTERM sorting domain-containing protein n=1 Tax=Baaleninema sp. TaxID=3101197 RepID=UPI003CFC8781
MNRNFLLSATSGVIAFGLGAIAMPQAASAGTVACDVSIKDVVNGASLCEVSDTATQDFLNTDPMTVNAESFFGKTDWSFISKDETGGQSGSWDIGSSFSDFEDVMLVFKSGRGTYLTGYLLDGSVTSGNWTNPFEKDVSHVSVYGRGTPSNPPTESVPEPAMVLGLAAVAFGAIRRRNR